MSVMFGPDTAIYPFPPKPTPLSIDEKVYYCEETKRLLEEHNAMTVAYYYIDPEIQQSAEETGGCISDSLEMACFDAKHPVSMLLVTGVRFMGETVKILSPERAVLMSIPWAECSLDFGYPVEELDTFCDAHPDCAVVAHTDTSATVKARTDQVATSSIAAELIDHLDSLGEKTTWVPDKYLGCYV